MGYNYITMSTTIQLRRDTSSNWTLNNPILSQAEVGFETDTDKFKIGDGESNWSSLQYFIKESDILNLQEKVPGMITQYAGTTAPSGYLLCQGQAVSRVTYADLFSVIGIKYGAGNGSSTFNLPDLRSKFPAGYNPSASSFDELGKTGGSSNHEHVFFDISSTTNSNQTRSFSTGSTSISTPTTSHTHVVSNTSETESSIPPYITLNYIIKF